MDEEREVGRDGLVLVVRKSAFGLPTACPACLSAYIYLRFAQVHFNTHYNVINPDSGGRLLTILHNGQAQVYFNIGDPGLYQNAAAAYESLSTKLGEQSFFFENRPTSLDAIFLGHALFVLQTSTDSSVMRRELMKHDNLIRYAENLKNEFLESEGSTSIPRFPSEPASSSKAGKSRTSHGGAKYKGSKENAKKERTEEEKIFRKRAKYFLITQFVAVIVFLTLMGGSSEDDVELEDEDGMIVDD